MRLGLLCDDLNEKRRWLEEAARNGWQAAKLELEDLEDGPTPCGDE